MKINKILLALVLLPFMPVLAQESPFSASYTNNEQLVSPSNVGLYDYMSVHLNSRLQLLGFEDGPTSFFLSANSAIDDVHGVGIMAFSDRAGISSQTGAYFDYSYRTPIGLDYNMAFGIGPKLFQYSFNDSEADLINPIDPIFGLTDQSSFSADVRAGVTIFSDDLLLSLSVDNLIQSSINLSTKDNRLNHLQRELSFYTHYNFQLENANNFSIEPSILLRSKLYGHFTAEANFDVVYQDLFYAGASYRFEDSYGFRLGLRSKEIILSYQLEVNSSDINVLGKTSHEFSIGFRIFNEKSSQNNRWYERHKENAWIGKDSIIKRTSGE